MANVSNFSENASVQVFGTRAGADVHFLLGPGRQTADDVNVRAVKGGDSVTIFDSDRWWNVITDEVFVYDYEDSMFDDWFVSDLSLHCVPFLAVSGVDPPWNRGYAPAPDGFTPPALNNTDTFDQDPTYEPDPFAEREIDTHSFLFGRFVRTKNFITVRLDAMRVGGLDEDVMLGLLPSWKEEIELVWSGRKTGVPVPPPTGSADNLLFECDWLNTTDGTRGTAAKHGEDHYTVLIGERDERESLFTWNRHTSLTTAAHEYGHYIGLDDGYTYDGELPWIRKAVQSQQLPISNAAIKDFLTGFGKPLYPWVVFQALWNSERVQQRLENLNLHNNGFNTCCDARGFDIMERSRNQLITPCMIDAIDTMVHKKMHQDGIHVSQPLCWQERLYQKYL